jgi:asparagine synthase (glutamine-hydrolysing)
MCGFVGVVALNGAKANAQIIGQMSIVLHHRGPDDEDIYVSGPIGFGFRRLSILDLSTTGHQPMSSQDGQTVLVFNGEIYNYIELRKELQSLGHEFKSSGDTEVLLHAYLQWGRQCLNKLNGMWAFLIYDMRRRKIFGSRDRFGKKPLYRYRCGDYIFFGSEIKAILASGHYCGGPKWETVSEFLLYGNLESLDEGRQTFYSGIEQLPAGSAFELDLHGRFHEWRFWSLADLPGSEVTNPAESFYEIFEDALRLRLRSDVPVGIFLSGGLDSTSIVCTLAKIRSSLGSSTAPLLAFSYQAKEYDESVYINDTVKQTGAQLIRFAPDPRQLWDRLEQVLWHQDEPVHSIVAVITFELSRLASASGVKVILNGGGPDEFLAGYHHFFINYWYTLLKRGRIREVWREIHAYCLAHGGNPWTLFQQSLYYQFRSKIGRMPGYQQLARRKRSRELRNHSWFTPELSDHLPVDNHTYSEPTLDAVLKQAVECAPLPLYLRIEDRNSMAHSIEARMPFLDYRLVSLAFQLPANWKMHGPWNKYVLREAMRQQIPESVRSRLDKMGFPAPTKSWFADTLYAPTQDLLASQEVRERGIYNVGAIRRDLELHRQGKVDVSSLLFNVIQFEIWSELKRTYAPKCVHIQRKVLRSQTP